MTRRPPRSPLFPSTPLSRSSHTAGSEPSSASRAVALRPAGRTRSATKCEVNGPREPCRQVSLTAASRPAASTCRSEEHTSELQSPCNLVCRLLLEKKNKLGFDATRVNQILKQHANREMRLSLCKVTVPDALAAQPVISNRLTFMLASLKIITVSNL